MFSGKKYTVIIQGCRTNQYEGEAIASLLERAGAVQDEKSPDIVVAVSCCITETADRKCRKLLRKARREFPRAVIAAVGCYAQRITPQEQEALAVDVVLGNRLKYKLPAAIEDFISNGEKINLRDTDIAHNTGWDGLTLDRPRMHTRAFLKVQDGCNHYCSYCIVPSVRGLPVSRSIEETVCEARQITESGCHEIVLTGIHLGLYRELAELVRRLTELPNLLRLRFGSIEPLAVSEKLLETLAGSEKFCRHLHIPLQSGDGGVLNAMRRGYSPEKYAAVVSLARAYLGDELHISTDMMFGFPAEDERAYMRSIEFAREMRFGKIHVFPYSPRENTAAAKMKQICAEERERRALKALETANELHRAFAAQYIGRECKILVEEKKNGKIRGLTKNYLRVTGDGDAGINEEATVRPARYDAEELFD